METRTATPGTSASLRFVRPFGRGTSPDGAVSKELLGGKGAGLAVMSDLGLPVPPGFTVTTEACRLYFEAGKRLPEEVWTQLEAALAALEAATGKRFGDPARPLLLSVRSGARVSMPGMMDTVLNLGMSDAAVRSLAEASGSERFAYDTYRRFLSLFSSVVLGVKRDLFEEELAAARAAAGVRLDAELGAAALKTLCERFKAVSERASGRRFPEDPREQLRLAVGAVFDSWFGDRAAAYRRIYGIPADWGTAANVQTMVFGNMSDRSGSGVAFSRDPNSGERRLFAEFLPNAQGEDVVAGIRTPLPVEALAREFPEAHAELLRTCEALEAHYRDMLDVEFTIEGDRFYMLQVRVGKRNAPAALRMALEMAGEGLIDRREAVLRVTPEQVEQLLHPMVDPKAKARVLARGLAASRGAASGKAVFTAKEAEDAGKSGEKVILVRTETSPEDVAGMHGAQGILTARGGMTSHAAVVARGMGKCCVVGCEALAVDEKKGLFTAGGTTVRAGDWLTLNGGTGEVMLGQVPLVVPEPGPELQTFLGWADVFRKLGVRANADTVQDAKQARKQGAGGIGLCRTEHMFFAKDRILAVRRMILAEDAAGRRKALETIAPMQRGDFEGLFREMAGFPVTVRLLDPPLHEFLPQGEEATAQVAQDLGLTPEKVAARCKSLKEFNPMLGHRGCRVGVTYPEIYESQLKALFEAACAVRREGLDVHPEVMIPLVAGVEELRELRKLCVSVAEAVLAAEGLRVPYTVGTMIEIPRAALLAGKLAAEAEFFSFGTNDLTQTAYGLSRDDAGKFLPAYIEKGLLAADPFVTLDQEGVGALVRMGVGLGRKARPDLEVGVCGEHGGDPASIAFFHEAGLDYVSCSPYRVPVARLAAAHAALNAGREASV